MDCRKIRTLLDRIPDDDLITSEREEVDAHLAACLSCAREYAIVTLPGRIRRVLPIPEPSPFFYSRLAARLRAESQGVNIWQIVQQLARHMVPALAVLTLILVSVFAYVEMSGPPVDMYQAYDSLFIPADMAQRMIITDPADITNETVLRALAEGGQPTNPQKRTAAPERE